MRQLNVTAAEFNAIQELLQRCEITTAGRHDLDWRTWALGLSTILGISEDELRQHAGAFPGGDLTKVNVVDQVDQRWS